MLSRLLIVVLFLASFASFGYGFWLVLGDGEPPKLAEDIPLRLEPAAQPRTEDRSDAPAEPRDPVTEEQRAAVPLPAPAPAPTPLTASDRPITLSLPIACDPGEDCWVVNFVDLDSGPGRLDYQCGQMSYDGHKGTDIALANMARLSENVPVLAAAAGRVGGVRDGMDDVNVRKIVREALDGRECGNGVRIDHGDGWVTQYCHLKKGSVLVSAGQQVEAGQALGAVGLSGLTEFPHVHLSVRRGETVVDPFRGVADAPACGIGSVPLWDEVTLGQLTAIPAPVLLDAGFADKVPSMEEAASGSGAVDQLQPDSEAVVLWLRATGTQPGDTARLMVFLPDGTVFFDETVTAERHRAAFFRAFGRKNTERNFPNGFPSGGWQGRITLSRDGVVTADRTFDLTVAPR